MVAEHLAICPHCGQEIFVVSGILEPDEELLSEMAEEMCRCKGATNARSKRDTEKRIQSILGEGAMKRGFNYSLPEETIEGIRRICEEIISDNFDKVTLTDRGGDVIKLVRDGNAVKIKRSTKRQLEM